MAHARTTRIPTALAFALAACSPGEALNRPPAPTAPPERPLVIAHRGASGERPEHTLGAYRLAIAQGADFIEPDLVPTRDGVLIARHENDLSGTTDVAERPEFADRRTTKRIDGAEVTGWFSEDFTLAEIRTLRARERIPRLRPANTAWNDREGIPTLAEILALIREAEAEGRRVGLYPETKHPTYFAHEGRHLDGSPIGLSLGMLLVEALVAEGFTAGDRVFIQSFELANLLELKREILPAHGLDLPLIFLTGELRAQGPHDAFSQPYDLRFHSERGDALDAIYGDLAAHLPDGIHADTGYAQLTVPTALAWLARSGIAGIGPWKESLYPRLPLDPPPTASDAPHSRLTGAVHPLPANARAAGLAQVHPYTLRTDPPLLAQDADGRTVTMEEEIARLLAAGATGFFTDYPAAGVAARDAFLRSTSR